MGYVGAKPSAVPLTSADITDGIITSAKIADGTIVNADINASAGIDSTKLSGSFGKVLQVVSTTKTDTFSTTSSSFVDVTGLSVSITPSSTSNKILVIVTMNTGGAQTSNLNHRLNRDSTAIVDPISVVRIGQDAQSEYQGNYFSFSYLDSPSSTSALSYKTQAKTNNDTLYVNRPYNTGGFNDTLRSSITVMEIAG